MADNAHAALTNGTHPDPDPHGPWVSDPAELFRLIRMLEALVDEVHDVDLDAASCRRLSGIQHRAVDAVKDLVSDDLEDELTDLGLPIEEPGVTAPELRLAHAQLVGWLHGLFQGLEAASVVQQLIEVGRRQRMQQAEPARGARRAAGNPPLSPYL